jgi:hypothetical protein
MIEVESGDIMYNFGYQWKSGKWTRHTCYVELLFDLGRKTINLGA